MQNTPLHERGCGRRRGTRLLKRARLLEGNAVSWRDAERAWDLLPNSARKRVDRDPTLQ